MKNLIYYIAFFLVLTSCTSHESTDSRLILADSLMTDCPDSAYTVLKAVNSQELSTKADKAYYALLYTQALDKNYIDVTNDSLINIAVDFYDDSDKYMEKIKSYYYLGRVKYNARDYFNALYAYTEAEQLIDHIKDDYLKGLLYTQIGNIYFDNYDFGKSLEYYKEAFQSYKKAGLNVHENYALHDIALSYWNLMENKKSEKAFLKCLNNAENSDCGSLIRSCLGNLVVLYIESGDEKKAKATYQSMMKKGYTFDSSSGIIGAVYLNILENRLDSIEYNISKAWSYAKDKNDTISLAFKCAKIEKSLGNTTKALHFTEIALAQHNDIIRKTLRQPVLTAQKEFYYKESILAKMQNRLNTFIFIMVTSFVLLVVFVFIKYHRNSMKLKNAEINQFFDKVSELSESLNIKNNEVHELNIRVTGLNSEIQNSRNQITEMNTVLQELFRSKFDYIEELGNTIYERTNIASEKEILYNKVRKMIDSFGQDKKTLNELEKIINKYHNNIMGLIRADFPKIKENDIKLLCYMFGGFSNRVISLFLNESVEYIAVRKSRLKSKILSKYGL